HHVEQLDNGCGIERSVAVIIGPGEDVGFGDVDDAHRQVVVRELWKCLQRGLGSMAQRGIKRRVGRQLLELVEIRVSGRGREQGQRVKTQFHFNLPRIFSATFAGVNPKCSAICSKGADAPNRSMPITSASRLTYLYQPDVRPASMATTRLRLPRTWFW